jgi:hypothetical protein
MQKHFAIFSPAIKKVSTAAQTKWACGFRFFGSGKSHFLKILSYLLENKVVEGKKAIDYFVDDNKIPDTMVMADMQLAASVPPM